MNEITKNVLIEFINKNKNIVNFGSPEDAVDESWILKAEKYLGFPLTNSYKWFLREYRGGEICGEEIYSIYGLDFESVNGGDIVYHHIIDMKSNIIKKTQLVVSQTDFGDVYYFDYTKFDNEECPIYIMFPSAECKFYATNFYEFLYKRIKDYL
ncbi:SMI1/KNR4 family protein [Gilliamella intestini]|uniref:SMI1-KNR4 cell-wall n=1 Tax=Gilliamella intestini TaxID=1798183 RepID=A0A1C4DUP0_9GAMM|nr:SMI1/KNR4 family protein [Gilliamella intestini]SCC34990.1 SMI1-KNR4 cell-wall [Gilliamella intestini]